MKTELVRPRIIWKGSKYRIVGGFKESLSGGGDYWSHHSRCIFEKMLSLSAMGEETWTETSEDRFFKELTPNAYHEAHGAMWKFLENAYDESCEVDKEIREMNEMKFKKEKGLL